MKIGYISTLGLILFFILSSCSKTDTIPMKKKHNKSSIQDDDDDSSSSKKSRSSQDPSDPDIDYISEIPENPIQTIKDLAFEAGCSIRGCDGIFDNNSYGCRLYCGDLTKITPLINCSIPDTLYSAIDCNGSKYKDANIGLTLNYTINENTKIDALAFYVYMCGSDISNANYRRRCRLKNIGINKKPKTFKVLMAYPGCGYNKDDDTGMDYTMVHCDAGQQTVDMLLEKVKCSGWEQNYDDCPSEYKFGLKQNDDYINVDDEITSFELLDCIKGRIGKSCRLK